MPFALVTGAGVRVGRAIAEALVDAGYDILVHANQSQVAAKEVAQHARARGRDAQVFLADLTQENGAAALAASVGQCIQSLDLLVNSAAIYEQQPFAQITLASYRRMLALNLEAPFFLTQALLPMLERAPAPVVINVTDAALTSAYRTSDTLAHYLTSKAGLAGLTMALARELAPRIRVNAVAPGAVALPAKESDGAFVQNRVPLRSIGTPADIGKAVVFLARDASYVTGQIFHVDGGLSAW